MSRSFDPLARRLCKALYDLLAGKHTQWVSVTRASAQINVTNAELLNGAITYAAQKGWLMVGGQPVHSLLLTQPGEVAATRKR